MNHRIAGIITKIEYGLGSVIALWSVYLMTGPLHPGLDEAHSGMAGVLSGLILLSISIAIFIAARAMQRGGRRHWLEQFGVIILCAGLFAVLLLSRI
ncbi:MAG: hypothetical protein V4484_02405 [Pseudomonadota bacterium]